MSQVFTPTLDGLSVTAILSSLPSLASHSTLSPLLRPAPANPPKSRAGKALVRLASEVALLPKANVSAMCLEVLNDIAEEKDAPKPDPSKDSAAPPAKKKKKKHRAPPKYTSLGDTIEAIKEAVNEDLDDLDEASQSAIAALTESLSSPASYSSPLSLPPLPSPPLPIGDKALPVLTICATVPQVLLDVLDYEFSSTLYLNHRPSVLAEAFLKTLKAHLLPSFPNAALMSEPLALHLPTSTAHILLLPHVPERYLMPNSTNNFLRLLPSRSNQKKPSSSFPALPDRAYNNAVLALSRPFFPPPADVSAETTSLFCLWLSKNSLLSPAGGGGALSLEGASAILSHLSATGVVSARQDPLPSLRAALAAITNGAYLSHGSAKRKAAVLATAAHPPCPPSAEFLPSWLETQPPAAPLLLTPDHRYTLLPLSSPFWSDLLERASHALAAPSVPPLLVGEGCLLPSRSDLRLPLPLPPCFSPSAVEELLALGLEGRVSTVRASREEGVCLRLARNPTAASFSVVTKGPSVGGEGAADFKKLWGAKAEVRKFNDAGVVLCVVWNGGKPCRRGDEGAVVAEIAAHLIRTHYAGGTAGVSLGGDLANVVDDAEINAFGKTVGLIKAFEAFAKMVKDVSKDSLPLPIDGVTGISP
jgi:hypothetical protein